MTPLEQASAILKAAQEATAAPWHVDTVKNEGGDGEYDSYRLQISRAWQWSKTLADSTNADECEIHTEYDEDSVHRWDEVARKNFAFIALARNTAPAIALALIEKHRALTKAIDLLREMQAIAYSGRRQNSQAELFKHFVAAAKGRVSEFLARQGEAG